MKKKFLSAILILILGLTSSLVLFSNTATADPNPETTEEKKFEPEGLGKDVQLYQTRKESAENNYDIHKAYAAFKGDRTDETAENLNKVMTDAGMKDMKFKKETTANDTLTEINKEIGRNMVYDPVAFGVNYTKIPEGKKEQEAAIQSSKENLDQAKIKHEVAQGDLSSQKKIDEFQKEYDDAEKKCNEAKEKYNKAREKGDEGKMAEAKKEIAEAEQEMAKAKSRQGIAETVRRFQDLDRIKKLGCTNEKEVKDELTKAACDKLVKDYNTRCSGLEKTKTKDKETDKEKSEREKEDAANKEKCDIGDAPIDPKKHDAAKEAAAQAVQKEEEKMQAALKKELMGEKLEVSKILLYRTKETRSKTLEEIDKIKFIQANYIEHGIVYFISRIVDSLVLATGSLAVVALIIGGYLLMFSGADEQKREAGKEVLKYTIIGMIFIFSSYAIVSFIMGLFYSA